MNRIVIAGIDTEVGKTAVSAIVAEALSGRYWKPVQCGEPEDRIWVEKQLTSRGRCFPSSFVFKTPCSPHLAAKNEGLRIEARDLIPPCCPGFLVIEGTGGLLAPLNETETWADAAIQWSARWILVHRHYLGSLNHFALTVEAIQRRKIDLLGVVFNEAGDRMTEEMLLKRANCHCLWRLKWQHEWNIPKIANQWRAALLKALGS